MLRARSSTNPCMKDGMHHYCQYSHSTVQPLWKRRTVCSKITSESTKIQFTTQTKYVQFRYCHCHVFSLNFFHHDNISYRYCTLIRARESPRKLCVHYLLLWLRLIAHVQGVVEGCSYVSCRIMFFEILQGGMRVGQHTETQHTCFKEKTCSIASGQKDEDAFCLVSFSAHCPSWDGGSWRCLSFIRPQDKGHSCSFSRRDLALSFLSSTTLMILECSSLLTCVHLKISSCRTPRVDVESGCGAYHLLCFLSQSKKQRQERYFLLGGCRGLSTLLASVVFGHLPSLPGNIEFSGAFWEPSSFASAPAGGICVSGNLLISGGSLSVSNSSAGFGGAPPIEMSNSLRSFEGRAASADEVAYLLMSMQSLPMPRRALANVTGLFV